MESQETREFAGIHGFFCFRPSLDRLTDLPLNFGSKIFSLEFHLFSESHSFVGLLSLNPGAIYNRREQPAAGFPQFKGQPVRHRCLANCNKSQSRIVRTSFMGPNVTKDIFDYFDNNSPRKFEPIEDEFDDDDLDEQKDSVEDDQEDSDADTEPADLESSVSDFDDQVEDLEEEDLEDAPNLESDDVAATSDQDESGDVSEAEEAPAAKRSHWDRLLGKLGIASPKSPPPQPASVEVTIKKDSAPSKKKKKPAEKKAPTKKAKPFGGELAPQQFQETEPLRVETSDPAEEIADVVDDVRQEPLVEQAAEAKPARQKKRASKPPANKPTANKPPANKPTQTNQPQTSRPQTSLLRPNPNLRKADSDSGFSMSQMMKALKTIRR